MCVRACVVRVRAHVHVCVCVLRVCVCVGGGGGGGELTFYAECCGCLKAKESRGGDVSVSDCLSVYCLFVNSFVCSFACLFCFFLSFGFLFFLCSFVCSFLCDKVEESGPCRLFAK